MTLGISRTAAPSSVAFARRRRCVPWGVVSCVCEAGREDQWAQGTGQQQCPGFGPGTPWKSDRGADVRKRSVAARGSVRTLSSRQSPVSPAIIFKAEAAREHGPHAGQRGHPRDLSQTWPSWTAWAWACSSEGNLENSPAASYLALTGRQGSGLEIEGLSCS